MSLATTALTINAAAYGANSIIYLSPLFVIKELFGIDLDERSRRFLRPSY